MRLFEELVMLFVAMILAFMLALVFSSVIGVLRLVDVYESKLEKLRALELVMLDRNAEGLKSCTFTAGKIRMEYESGKSVTYELRYSPSTSGRAFYRVAKMPGSRPGYNMVYRDGNLVSVSSEASGSVIILDIGGLRVAFTKLP